MIRRSLSALARALVVSALPLLGLLGAGWGAGGCTLVLETDIHPHKCKFNSECAHLKDAVCDNARGYCVPRLPYGNEPDGGAPAPDSGSDAAREDPAGLTCQIAFDSRRLPVGPDGGLRPLPEVP